MSSVDPYFKPNTLGGNISALKMKSNPGNISFKSKIPPAPPEKVMKGLGKVGKKMAKSLWNKNGTLYKTAKLANNIPGLAEAAFVFLVTTTLRPATIMAVPGPKKEDRQYAAGHSISTGVVGLIFGMLLFKPFASSAKRLGAKAAKKMRKKIIQETMGKEQLEKLKNAANPKEKIGVLREVLRNYQTIEQKGALGHTIKKILDNPKTVEINESHKKIFGGAVKNLKLKPEHNQILEKVIKGGKVAKNQNKGLKEIYKEMKPNVDSLNPLFELKEKYSNFNYISNNIVKFVTAPLQAMMLVALVPPIVKTVFGQKKNKANNSPTLPAYLNLNQDNKNIFKNFSQLRIGDNMRGGKR